MDIKRYCLVERFSGWYLLPDSHGAYIKYDDHLEAIAALEARCKELEYCLNQMVAKTKHLKPCPATLERAEIVLATTPKKAGE